MYNGIKIKIRLWGEKVNITYRKYQSGDESQIVKLWNKTLLADPISQERFRHLVLLDANFNPNGMILAFDREKLVGVTYGVIRQLPLYQDDLEPNNGWISFFFVDSDYESQGIGQQLLNRLEDFFIKHQRQQIFFSAYAPNYILPGIDTEQYPKGHKLLINQGFEKQYTAAAMDYSLLDYTVDSSIDALIQQRQQEGYVIRRAQDGDLFELIQFANEEFNPDWGRAIREGLIHGMPMNQIFITRNPDGDMVGFGLYGAYEGMKERFGPFGVDPNERGKGLGKIILNLCLNQMKSEGYHNAWFLWTGEKTAAGYLYLKTGFEVTRRFDVMKKELQKND